MIKKEGKNIFTFFFNRKKENKNKELHKMRGEKIKNEHYV